MKYLAITFLIYLTQASTISKSISLRPKPKARAGGADASAAAVYSFAYLSHVSIGSPKGLFTLSLSVLENDIWVMNPDCEECKLTYIQYNFSSSDSEKTSQSTQYLHEMLNIDAVGTYYKDSIQIDEYESVNYQVAVADKFVDVYGLAIDGILGLGSNESSIVYKMYQEGKLDAPIYSLSFLNDPLLILGTPNFLDLSLVIESQQQLSFKQDLQITKFSFGSHEDEEVTKVELNSMSSYITGPAEILERIYKILTEEGCHYEEELLMCECEHTEYPTFNFVIQGQELNLDSSQYLIQLGDNCFLALKSGSHWILGEPFFKGYFTQFDLQERSLIVYKTSALTMEKPSPFDTTEGWAAMISLGIGSIAVYVMTFVVYLKYEDYKIAKTKQENHMLAHSKPRVL